MDSAATEVPADTIPPTSEDATALTQELAVPAPAPTHAASMAAAFASHTKQGRSHNEPAVDVSSRDLFPALPTPSTPAAQSSASASTPSWGSAGSARIRTSAAATSSASNSTEILTFHPSQLKQGVNFQEALKRLGERAHVKVDVSTSKTSSVIQLSLTGKLDLVKKAKKDVISTLIQPYSFELEVAKEHHGHILGAQGKRIIEISTKHACRVIVPKADDPSEIIKIIGDPTGVNKAREDILAIVEERTNRVAEKLFIDKTFVPFFLSVATKFPAQADEIHGPKETTRVKVDPAGEIEIKGERKPVAAVLHSLNTYYENLMRQTKMMIFPIPYSQHKFLIGPKGANVMDILDTTGCAITFPLGDTPEDLVYIRGPQMDLVKALTAIQEKLASSNFAEVPVSESTRRLLVLRHLGKLKNFEKETGASVHLGREGVEIQGKQEEVGLALVAVTEFIRELDSLTIEEVQVPQRLHKYLVGKKGASLQKLRDDYGVDIHVPSSNDDSEDIIVAGTPEGVAKAKEAISQKANEMADFTVDKVTVDPRFHPRIRGKVLDIQKLHDVHIRFPDKDKEKEKGQDENDIVISGPSEDVRAAKDKVQAIADKARHDEVMSSYTIEFTMEKKLARLAKGNLTRRVKEEFELVRLEIDDSDGKVVIQGVKKPAEDAKLALLDRAKKLADMETIEITVEPKYRGLIIGEKGSTINKLQTRYNVIIKFPDAEPAENGVAEEDGDTAKASKPKKSNGPSSTSASGAGQDKVFIKGNKEDVQKVKQEILELIDYQKARSHTIEFSVDKKAVPRIVGKQGANIDKIRNELDLKIDLVDAPAGSDGQAQVRVVLQGTKEAIDAAKKRILALNDEPDRKPMTNITFNIEPRSHALIFLRKGGSTRLKDLWSKFQGVSFSGQAPDQVTLRGPIDQVEAAKKEVEAWSVQLASTVSETLHIPVEVHSLIIGSGGNNLRSIQARFGGVDIQFPPRGGDDSVTVSGQPDDVARAVEYLTAQIPVSKSIPVPKDIQRFVVGKAGNNIRKCRSEYNVFADMTDDGVTLRGAEADLVKAEAYIHGIIAKATQEGARSSKGTNGTAEAAGPEETEVIEVNPEFHRHIVGRNGAVIQKIREESGAKVTVPQQGSNSNKVVIQGRTRQAVEKARDLVLKIVDEHGDFVVNELEVEQRQHRNLIGVGGENIKGIQASFPGVQIKFPSSGETSNVIRLQGKEDQVQAVRQRLLELVV